MILLWRNDGNMSSRGTRWAGGVVAVAVVVGLAVYFRAVGLDRADKTASVLGAFLGLAGLALSVYGVVGGRAGPSPASSPQPGGTAAGSASPSAEADPANTGPHDGPASVEGSPLPGAVVNTIRDSTIFGGAVLTGSTGMINFSSPAAPGPRDPRAAAPSESGPAPFDSESSDPAGPAGGNGQE